MPLPEEYRKDWEAFLMGNREAFGRLYAPFHEKLTLYCLGLLHDRQQAEDVASEVLHKLYTWEPLEGIEQFDRWLFTVAKNQCLSHMGQQKRRKGILDGIRHLWVHREEAKPELNMQEEHVDRLKANVLTEKEQAVWQWHEQGYDNEEIAQRTGMSVKTVANHKSQARAKLKGALKKETRE